jgi:hypothetical protein
MCLDHYVEALEHSAHIVSLSRGYNETIIVDMPEPKKVLDTPPIL